MRRSILVMLCGLLSLGISSPALDRAIAGGTQAEAVIVAHSRQFQKALAKGDASGCLSLALPNATWFGFTGEDSVAFPAMVRLVKGGSLNTGVVVSREVSSYGTAAVAHEITHSGPEELSPVRRSLFWTQHNGQWKLAHIHSSPYQAWQKEIARFEEQDQQETPKPGGVVFVGSSSIRDWKTLQQDFPATNVIGRGFGGSELIDSIAYAPRIVTNYQPRAVAVYAGDNDIARGKKAARVFRDFRRLVEVIHRRSPQARIGFIAVKPSIKRWNLWPEMKRANSLIHQYASGHERIAYLDIATPMLGTRGMPREDLFVEDGLHLNRKGYELWASVVRSWLTDR
ncbi:MAG: hypothetical protein CMJ62_18945 [Planctomycetaceae bacterium]|nr:hypothetical protein [Planctomycetaceae bacterium]